MKKYLKWAIIPCIVFCLDSCDDDDVISETIDSLDNVIDSLDQDLDSLLTPNEDISSFRKITSLTVGDEGAAEISAYDTDNKQLFVVNNAGDSKVDVINFGTPSSLSVTSSIDLSNQGGGINSIAVGAGYLAVAVEADTKTDNGSVIIYNLSDLSQATSIEVGALPDMVTFSPDEQYILTANEGEPSDDYTTDPVGSVTIITVDGFTAKTIGFESYNDQVAELAEEGFRVGHPNATLAQDAEPEYVAISDDSKTAYVALQENNGLAIIDLENQSLTALKGLGYKDWNAMGAKMDPSEEVEDEVEFVDVPANIFGVYQPDAIDAFTVGDETFIISANEGDGREYFFDSSDEATCLSGGGIEFDEDDGCLAFIDEEKVRKLDLEPTAFPTAEEISEKTSFGNLKVMTDIGDANRDGFYEALYTYGARSFSIWDAEGNQVYDSGDDLDMIAHTNGIYDDGRSENKGTEPEGVVVGEVNGKMLAFVGLERVDAIAIYDVSTPTAPTFVSLLDTGDAPEGLVFIHAKDSPTNQSLLVVSCEGDGSVWVYAPKLLP